MNLNVPTKAKLEPSAGGNEPSGKVHQFLNDGPDPSALGRMPDRYPVADQPQLADKPQDVVDQCSTAKDQLVGGKFARRQSFQVHVGLEFGMELCAGAMIPVQGDDLLLWQLKRGPPPL